MVRNVHSEFEGAFGSLEGVVSACCEPARVHVVDAKRRASDSVSTRLELWPHLRVREFRSLLAPFLLPPLLLPAFFASFFFALRRSERQERLWRVSQGLGGAAGGRLDRPRDADVAGSVQARQTDLGRHACMRAFALS